MSKRAAKALEGSIKKWEGIVADTIVDMGQHNCPLCKLYFENDCKGCPISEAVGDTCCDGTPYPDYAGYPSKENAEKELAFLKSLREVK